MNRDLLMNIGRFFFLVLLQVFVFNKIYLWGYINPFAFLMFVILLPYEISGMALLFFSFLMGFTIDLFSGTLGVHAAATTFVGFARSAILNTIMPKRDNDSTSQPGVNYMGIQTYLIYVLIIAIIHHFVFFFLDTLRVSELPQILMRTLLSSLTTTTIIVVLTILFKPRDKKRK